MPYRTDDVRIQETRELLTPQMLLEEFPLRQEEAKLVYETRQAIHRMLHGQDYRLAVIAGPCSIHDTHAAIDYGGRLLEMAKAYSSHLLVIMRVYFEKPRTTVGWKGLINDPFLDESFQINEGLRRARQLLVRLCSMGMPAGTEFLDMITPQYIGDLISWGAIGARTTESQVHRELASGLSCPVGFKNGTDGNVRIAVDAVRAARIPHHFLSVTKAGHSAIVCTKGNKDCHVILRGGKLPNFDEESVEAVLLALRAAKLPEHIMIDCSHANSMKNYRLQGAVARNVAGQISGGQKGIFGVMLESNLVAGRQDLIPGKELVYGQSITDACIDLEETKQILEMLAEAVEKRNLRIGGGTR
ncbi:MAG: 3-deoxy-7-phosphoheptulonate synthase [Bryobacteraceae bacterium]|nr:3-deoxy-7-phosphoheptulonate synthase [Bryobacteraceae bacterium]MDW8380346.1 3-deoxy-7-phosphoheptulonate synthase [Bryobacterales bacterium]